MTYAWRILLVVAFCLAAAVPSRAGLVMAGGCPSKQDIQRSCPVEPASQALPAKTVSDAKCGMAVLHATHAAATPLAEGVSPYLANAVLPDGLPAERDDPPPRPRHS